MGSYSVDARKKQIGVFRVSGGDTYGRGRERGDGCRRQIGRSPREAERVGPVPRRCVGASAGARACAERRHK